MKGSSSEEPAEGKADPQKRRAAFYVDGFNLYHALKDLGKPHLLWLDLWALAEALINPREEQVVKVVWCSAEYRRTPEHIMRHRAYKEALKAKGVTPILGHFIEDTLRCQATCNEEYKKTTEKAGDVNTAIYLIADGLQDIYDNAYLISADSDQVGTVDLFGQRLAKKKKLTVVAPPERPHSKDMIDRPVGKKTIKVVTVERCLLGKNVLFKDGNIASERPENYDPPPNWKKPSKEADEAQEEVITSPRLPRRRSQSPVLVERKPSRKPTSKD